MSREIDNKAKYISITIKKILWNIPKIQIASVQNEHAYPGLVFR